ncbi:MAG: YtxH domain-containing protein [Chloroflexota bacterium]|nr:YtxH domain-containing protein [Chloroflexota bacterium]
MGFIIGVLTGAVVALLYAPKTGDITREELKVRSEELKRRADELQKIAQKLADDASVKGRELIDEAKKQWDSSGVGRASTGPRTTPGGSTKQD